MKPKPSKRKPQRVRREKPRPTPEQVAKRLLRPVKPFVKPGG